MSDEKGRVSPPAAAGFEYGLEQAIMETNEAVKSLASSVSMLLDAVRAIAVTHEQVVDDVNNA